MSKPLTNNSRLLLVDDDEIFLSVLSRAMAKRGFDVVSSAGIADALEQAAKVKPAMAVVDLKLEGESGLDLIPRLIDINPDMNIIVLTGYSSIATAVTAIKRGAADYLSKPVTASDVARALSGERSEGGGAEGFNPMSVERMEWEHIQKVLKENDGNISATARSLGMYRRGNVPPDPATQAGQKTRRPLVALFKMRCRREQLRCLRALL